MTSVVQWCTSELRDLTISDFRFHGPVPTYIQLRTMIVADLTPLIHLLSYFFVYRSKSGIDFGMGRIGTGRVPLSRPWDGTGLDPNSMGLGRDPSSMGRSGTGTRICGTRPVPFFSIFYVFFSIFPSFFPDFGTGTQNPVWDAYLIGLPIHSWLVVIF